MEHTHLPSQLLTIDPSFPVLSPFAPLLSVFLRYFFLQTQCSSVLDLVPRLQPTGDDAAQISSASATKSQPQAVVMAPMNTMDKISNRSQKWKLTKAGYVENLLHGTVLEVQQGSIPGSNFDKAIGKGPCMATPNGSASQKWEMDGDGVLRSLFNGLVLHCPAEVPTAQVSPVLAKLTPLLQRWSFVSGDPADATGGAANDAGRSESVVDAALEDVVAADEAPQARLHLRDDDAKVLCVPKGAGGVLVGCGAKVILGAASHDSVWKFTEEKYLESVATGLVLGVDTQGKYLEDGTAVRMWTKNGSKGQQVMSTAID